MYHDLLFLMSFLLCSRRIIPCRNGCIKSIPSKPLIQVASTTSTSDAACDNSPLSPLIHLPTSIALDCFLSIISKYFLSPFKAKARSYEYGNPVSEWIQLLHSGAANNTKRIPKAKIVETLHIWTFPPLFLKSPESA